MKRNDARRDFQSIQPVAHDARRGQAANLDNNSGPETDDEQTLTSRADAAGSYNGVTPVTDAVREKGAIWNPWDVIGPASYSPELEQKCPQMPPDW